MIQIRKNVFETNSSSTHSLCIPRDNSNLDIDESLFLKPYNISPISYMVYKATYTSIEDKLTYFLSIICMNLCNVFWDENNFTDETIDTETTAGQFYMLLKKVFPNTTFNLPKNFNDAHSKDLTYNYEDGDWVLADPWKDEEPDIQPLLNEYNLKQFMQYGIIYFYNRDDYCDREDEIIDQNLEMLVCVSG